jgi:hypothetical protein
MAVPNTLAYYIMTTFTAVKSFIAQAPGSIFTTLFLPNFQMDPLS